MPGQDLAGADSPLSGALSDFDARITALEKGGGQFSPGMVAWTTSDTAPPGWLIADGTAFDTARYAALAVIIPSGILPDLRDRFPIGAGNTYALLTTGGAATVTLTAAQSGVPAHAHPAGTTGAGSAHTHTVGNEASHTHSGTTGTQSVNHTHNSGISSAAGANVNNFVPPNNATGSGFNWTSSTESANHTHSFTTGAGSSHTHTLTSESAHTHTFTTPLSLATDASSSHSILNPYVALTPLIKF